MVARGASGMPLTQYIRDLTEPARGVLAAIQERAVLLVPGTTEQVSYRMPCMMYRGKPLLSVLQTKTHLGYYPFSASTIDAVRGSLAASGADTSRPEVAALNWSKGTVRFAVAHPIPDDVVAMLVMARKAEIDASLG
ncbi:MAG TPA: DUF1801 domain-containing protein [Candidatus Lumbricidophila sp.]|nr:DUF1801 domain-containing protein [Candidatus Lumbricidophila sp.]